MNSINSFILVPILFISLFVLSCASTEVIESPKTVFVPDSIEVRDPLILWSSQSYQKDFDYLAVVKTRSWAYSSGIDRLVIAARQLRADAIIDIHYEPVGFLASFHAFAIKYKP